MATDIVSKVVGIRGLVLRRVAWETYVALRGNEENVRVRMTYLDGTLTLMSPEYIRDLDSRAIFLFLTALAESLRISFQPTGTATLRRQGKAPRKGVGKEPDEGFYLGANVPRMRKRGEIDLSLDPPPDLAIEVDNSKDSRRALRAYARVRVPEVWIYKSRRRSLWFGRLEGEAYTAIDRSLGFAALTPALVLEALAAGSNMEMMDWLPWVRDRARRLPEPPAAP